MHWRSRLPVAFQCGERCILRFQASLFFCELSKGFDWQWLRGDKIGDDHARVLGGKMLLREQIAAHRVPRARRRTIEAPVARRRR